MCFSAVNWYWIQDSLGFRIPRYEFRIPGTGFRILSQWNLDSGFQSFVGLRIPWDVYSIFQSLGFRIPQKNICWIPDSTSQNFPDPGIRNPFLWWEVNLSGNLRTKQEHILCSKLSSTIYLNFTQPRVSEELRDWQNVFAIPRFHFFEVLYQIFYCYWAKENSWFYQWLLYIEVRYIEVLLYTWPHHSHPTYIILNTCTLSLRCVSIFVHLLVVGGVGGRINQRSHFYSDMYLPS